MCQVSLRELIELESNERISHDCLSKELIFQSGDHYLYDDNSMRSMTLTFRNFSSVILKGHPIATIKCLNQSLSFEFYDVSTITIKNIHVNKCKLFLAIENSSLEVNIKNSTFTDTGMILCVTTHYKHTNINLKA